MSHFIIQSKLLVVEFYVTCDTDDDMTSIQIRYQNNQSSTKLFCVVIIMLVVLLFCLLLMYLFIF